jgi:hypothetical protein
VLFRLLWGEPVGEEGVRQAHAAEESNDSGQARYSARLTVGRYCR